MNLKAKLWWIFVGYHKKESSYPALCQKCGKWFKAYDHYKYCEIWCEECRK